MLNDIIKTHQGILADCWSDSCWWWWWSNSFLVQTKGLTIRGCEIGNYGSEYACLAVYIDSLVAMVP